MVAGAAERLVVVGGWSRDPALLEVKRAILGPLEVPVVAETGARGAALIGGVAAGLFPDVLHLPGPPAAAHPIHLRSPSRVAELRSG